MLLYIITGQKKEFWKLYFQNIKLVYVMWGLMLKRGFKLKSFYLKKYGLLVGTFLVLSHAKMKNLRVPFRYYRSLEGFIIRNLLVLVLVSGIGYKLLISFIDIKNWFISICPDPKEVIYPDYYYPYAIFLVTSLIILLQLLLLISSKTIRFLLGKYKYELLVLNLINIFVLITVHCTVAHEGLLYVWWLPESYEMISFTNEEELVMVYWIGELKYYWNTLISDPRLLDIKLYFEWVYIVLYKALQI